MGCDIHSQVEVRTSGRWQRHGLTEAGHGPESGADEPFPYRNYGLFGFLADVRNYSHSPVIAEPRGLPEDVELTADERAEFADGWYHSASWLTLAEMLGYDYDQVFWDRRVTRQMSSGVWDGAALAEKGEGEHKTLRDFLGSFYFQRLDEMAKLGDPQDVRIVFWFDS